MAGDETSQQKLSGFRLGGYLIVNQTMLLDDDITLLGRYAEERDENAFAEVVRRHVDGVYSGALRRLGGDVQLAQDVTQMVFVALAREAARLSRHPVLTGWLYTTTRNAAANVVRAERRRKAREEETQSMHESLPESSSSEADWSRLALVLEEAMDRLNEADRLGVLLRFIERRSFSEIGRALNLSDEAARKRVERSIEKLRLLLERHGIRSTSTALGLVLTTHAVSAAPVTLSASVTGAALAITPAMSATAATGTILGFMSTTKLMVGGFALAGLIAALGTLSYEVHVRNQAEAELKLARDKEAALVANRRALEEQVNLAEVETARLKREVEDARLSKEAADLRVAAARSEAAKAAAAWDPKKEGLAFLERHPEARKALLERSLAHNRYKYSALFKQLHLTPIQIEEFLSLWSSGESLGMMGPDGKYMMYPLDDRGSDADSKMRVLLGDEGWRKFGEYYQLLPARELTVRVASALASTETPLTTAQSDQLVQIIATGLKKIYGKHFPAVDWERALNESAAVLSPPQQGVLAVMRAREALELAMNDVSKTVKNGSK